MNRLDYTKLLKEIDQEIAAPKGTFQSMFGAKTEKELEEIHYIAAVALVAADRYYSTLTRTEFEIREKDERKQRNGG